MKTKTIQFNRNGVPSVCDYHLFEVNGQHYLVIEQRCDTTTSITNAIELIVDSIVKKECLALDNTKLFEYYPKHKLENKPLYELSQIVISGGTAVWETPSRKDISQLQEALL